MIVRLLIVLALISHCAISHAEEIPLGQIWAYGMPGTRDVRELEPGKDLRKTTISKIRARLIRSVEEQPKAGPCFLVMGEGKEALLNAAIVIVDGTPPAKTLPPDKAVSLVFYSNPAPGYVHLHSVSRTDSRITVKYQVVIHRSANVTVHFALIPLGKLSPGRVILESFEVPSETPYANHSVTHRAVCDSCEFVIQRKGQKR